MKLITKEIEKLFESHPLYSTDGKSEKKVLAKYFGGSSFTCYVFEAERQDKDWLFFGLLDMGYGAELGYFTFSQIANLKFPPFGLGIERDMYGEYIYKDGKIQHV